MERDARDIQKTAAVKWLLVLVGLACVGLGALGAFVPGLPTTVFLIAACWCFTRSCPWLERKLIRENRLFAPFVVYLQPGAVMPRRVRIATLVIMWTAALISAVSLWNAGASPWIPVAIIAAVAVGSWFVCRFGRPGRAVSTPVATGGTEMEQAA
ncbi:MAG: YbaN family protein [Phycisphaerales bacterium]|nr:YbaN family protein [Phycisphaerales bacterium]